MVQWTPKTVYVTYIVASPEKVWAALTRAEMVKQYFFGRTIESDWKVGSPVRYWQEDGTLDVQGRIVESDEPRRLSYTWHVEWLEEYRKLPDCLVTFQLDDLGQVVRLTMTESHQWEVDEKLLEGGRRGWPIILSGLKTLLETGRPLPKLDAK